MGSPLDGIVAVEGLLCVCVGGERERFALLVGTMGPDFMSQVSSIESDEWFISYSKIENLKNHQIWLWLFSIIVIDIPKIEDHFTCDSSPNTYRATSVLKRCNDPSYDEDLEEGLLLIGIVARWAVKCTNLWTSSLFPALWGKSLEGEQFSDIWTK